MQKKVPLLLKKTAYQLLFLFLIMLSGCSFNQFHSPSGAISKVIEPLQDKAFIGVEIKNLTDDRIIYSLNQDIPFTPASTLKLLTTWLALKEYGTQYRFCTKISCKGEIKDSVLFGDLYITPSGDPTLDSFYYTKYDKPSINALKNIIKDYGIKQVSGNLIFIQAIRPPLYRPGWMFDDLGTSWQNAITGLSVQNNIAEIFIISDSAGVQIRQDSLYLPLEIKNSLKAGLDTKIRINSDFEGNYELTGAIKTGDSRKMKISLANPEEYFLNSLMVRLKNEKVFSCTAGVIVKSDSCVDPKNLILIKEINSPNLLEICKVINKYSINSYAEQVDAFLLSKVDKEAVLDSVGMDISCLLLDDGSGLSVYNKIKPSDFTVLLSSIFHSGLRDDFISTLSVGGIDGTLVNKLTHPELKGRVFGKSGSMRNISNVVCYYHTEHDKWYSIVLMINNMPASVNPNRILDDVLWELRRY